MAGVRLSPRTAAADRDALYLGKVCQPDPCVLAQVISQVDPIEIQALAEVESLAASTPKSALLSQAYMCAALARIRSGSRADICGATSHVRFTPNCDCKSGHSRFVMSALPPKADMCGATSDVRFGPIANITSHQL